MTYMYNRKKAPFSYLMNELQLFSSHALCSGSIIVPQLFPGTTELSAFQRLHTSLMSFVLYCLNASCITAPEVTAGDILPETSPSHSIASHCDLSNIPDVPQDLPGRMPDLT